VNAIVIPAGAPEAVSETPPANPFTGAIVAVDVAPVALPATTLTASGASASV